MSESTAKVTMNVESYVSIEPELGLVVDLYMNNESTESATMKLTYDEIYGQLTELEYTQSEIAEFSEQLRKLADDLEQYSKHELL
jgi:SMC interacting uncharacterized protein involved in chromosome segregation